MLETFCLSSERLGWLALMILIVSNKEMILVSRTVEYLVICLLCRTKAELDRNECHSAGCYSTWCSCSHKAANQSRDLPDNVAKHGKLHSSAFHSRSRQGRCHTTSSNTAWGSRCEFVVISYSSTCDHWGEIVLGETFIHPTIGKLKQIPNVSCRVKNGWAEQTVGEIKWHFSAAYLKFTLFQLWPGLLLTFSKHSH